MSEVKPKEDNNSGGKPRYQGKGKDGRPPRGPPLSPAQQRRRAAEERISNWTPKTELGKKVVAGEITTVEEEFDTVLPLSEPPIIYLLIPDLSFELSL